MKLKLMYLLLTSFYSYIPLSETKHIIDPFIFLYPFLFPFSHVSYFPMLFCADDMMTSVVHAPSISDGSSECCESVLFRKLLSNYFSSLRN
jgi:hypothetical protein